MDLIKHIEYNKEYEGEMFLIELDYGMKEDKTNHVLNLKIWHITDKVKGIKHIALQDNIIDITSKPNIYQPVTDAYIDNLEEIKSFINQQISQIVESNNVKTQFIGILEKLEGEE